MIQNRTPTRAPFGRGSKATKEKGVQTCGATDEIVLRPKGILVGLAGSSRLGAYDAVHGDFLEFNLSRLDSIVKLAIHSVSPQMSFLNLGNMFLRFLIPSVRFETWVYLAFVSSEIQSSPEEEIHSFEAISCCQSMYSVGSGRVYTAGPIRPASSRSSNSPRPIRPIESRSLLRLRPIRPPFSKSRVRTDRGTTGVPDRSSR
jgi:hypothetical protein